MKQDKVLILATLVGLFVLVMVGIVAVCISLGTQRTGPVINYNSGTIESITLPERFQIRSLTIPGHQQLTFIAEGPSGRSVSVIVNPEEGSPLQFAREKRVVPPSPAINVTVGTVVFPVHKAPDGGFIATLQDPSITLVGDGTWTKSEIIELIAGLKSRQGRPLKTQPPS